MNRSEENYDRHMRQWKENYKSQHLERKERVKPMVRNYLANTFRISYLERNPRPVPPVFSSPEYDRYVAEGDRVNANIIYTDFTHKSREEMRLKEIDWQNKYEAAWEKKEAELYKDLVTNQLEREIGTEKEERERALEQYRNEYRNMPEEDKPIRPARRPSPLNNAQRRARRELREAEEEEALEDREKKSYFSGLGKLSLFGGKKKYRKSRKSRKSKKSKKFRKSRRTH
jgi:hypothetical protein